MKAEPGDNLHERYYPDAESGHLFLKATPTNRLCIPKCNVRLRLIQEYHDCVTAGHPETVHIPYISRFASVSSCT